jgi:hypothetical protein
MRRSISEDATKAVRYSHETYRAPGQQTMAKPATIQAQPEIACADADIIA